MKKVLFLLLLMPFLGNSQATFTAPVGYNTGAPTATPSGVGTRWRFDLLTGKKYTWLPGTLSWDEDARGIDQVSGCSAPLYTPGYNQSTFAVNSCTVPELYQWTGAAWVRLNEGATYTAGTGISINGSNVISNTAPDQTVTMTDGAGIDVTGTYPNFTVAIPAGGITPTELQSTSVTPGTYTYMSGTVDADGRLTAAGSGTAPVTGTGANGRGAFWTGATTQSSDGSWLWNNTTKRMTVGNYTYASGIEVQGTQSINPGAYTPSTGTNALLNLEASPNNTGINDVSIYGIRSVPSLINDGTPTGSSLYAVQGTASITTPTKATIAAAANFGGNNTSANLAQFYGVYGRIDERCVTGNLASRAALRFDMIKSDAGAGIDSHSGSGVIVSVSDNSTGGRWLTGTGVNASVSNAKTATGALVSTSHTRGTGNTAYGLSVSSSASGSGVVIDNAYGISLDVSTSVATISNYYGITLNSIPAGTVSWYLYNSTAAKSYLSGDVGIGTALPSQKLDVNGNARFRALTGFNVSSPASTIDVAGTTGYGQLRLQTTYTPTGTADALGATGDTAWDANYFYIKTAAGWKRTALSTF